MINRKTTIGSTLGHLRMVSFQPYKEKRKRKKQGSVKKKKKKKKRTTNTHETFC